MQVTSAQALEIEGARATIRNPVALWILTLLTLGILGAFWWYGISREIRDVSRALGRPLGNSPVFACTRRPLARATWIPAVISIYLGSRWIRTLEEGLGTSADPSHPRRGALPAALPARDLRAALDQRDLAPRRGRSASCRRLDRRLGGQGGIRRRHAGASAAGGGALALAGARFGLTPAC